MSRRSRKTYPGQLLGGERQTLGGGPVILGRPKPAEPSDSAALEPIVEALLELLWQEAPEVRKKAVRDRALEIVEEYRVAAEAVSWVQQQNNLALASVPPEAVSPGDLRKRRQRKGPIGRKPREEYERVLSEAQAIIYGDAGSRKPLGTVEETQGALRDAFPELSQGECEHLVDKPPYRVAYAVLGVRHNLSDSAIAKLLSRSRRMASA